MTSITSRHQRIETHLQACLGQNLSVVCTDVDGATETLWPEEAAAVAKAIPRRRREFAAGRAAAREAMHRLSVCSGAIPANPDRSPRWPAGIVGSISHTAEICLAVVGLRKLWSSIGIDIEPNQDIEESLWEIICAPDELRLVREQPPSKQAAFVARIFVAKEAFFKWQFPLNKAMLDFQDVSVQWRYEGRCFRVQVLDVSACSSINSPEGHVIALESQLFACIASVDQSKSARTLMIQENDS